MKLLTKKAEKKLRIQVAEEIRNEITKTLVEYRTNLFQIQERKAEVRVVDYFLDVVYDVINIYLSKKG